jgi:diguanylate cyclase (GGDEF)-like protein
VTTLRDQSLRPASLAKPQAPLAETVSSHGRSRLRAWVRTWLVLVAALLVAGAAGYGIMRVHHYAAERSELKAMLSRMEIVAHQQSALEWQAIAERGLSPELAQQWREVDEVVDSLPLQLARRDDSPEIRAVRDAFAAYDAAVDQPYDLLTSRAPAEAEALDERRVDPAFDQLLAALGVASNHYDAAAQQASRRADLGTVLLLLVAATIIGVLVWCFQRARAKAAELLAHQALHDGLTGLPNRTLLRDRTGQAIRQADRELVPAGLLLLDLDRFKEVNDTLGHHYGDQLLVQVGQRLQAALRAVDTVARLGGDEFAVLLPRIETAEGAVTVARNLQAALEEPFLLEGLNLDVEASIGVALYPEHGSDPDELLQHADIAMYAAKQTHAGYVLFDPTLDQHSPRRLALLGQLRRAIETEQLVLHYQPKVDAHTRQVLGSRRWCAGSTPSTAWSHRATSSPWPSGPGSSARSPTTCWTRRCASAGSGSRLATSCRWRSTSPPGGCSTSNSLMRWPGCWPPRRFRPGCWWWRSPRAPSWPTPPMPWRSWAG